MGYLAAGAAWATAWLEDLARTAETATGGDLFPAAGVIPLLALGGLVGIVATRGVARTIVGGFLVAAGATAAIWIIASDALTDWRNEPDPGRGYQRNPRVADRGHHAGCRCCGRRRRVDDAARVPMGHHGQQVRAPGTH